MRGDGALAVAAGQMLAAEDNPEGEQVRVEHDLTHVHEQQHPLEIKAQREPFDRHFLSIGYTQNYIIILQACS